jgi:hypothetical protein
VYGAELPTSGQSGRERFLDRPWWKSSRKDFTVHTPCLERCGKQIDGTHRVRPLPTCEHIDLHLTVLRPGVHRGVRFREHGYNGDSARCEPLGDDLPYLGTCSDQGVGQHLAQRILIIEQSGANASQLGQDVPSNRLVLHLAARISARR